MFRRGKSTSRFRPVKICSGLRNSRGAVTVGLMLLGLGPLVVVGGCSTEPSSSPERSETRGVRSEPESQQILPSDTRAVAREAYVEISRHGGGVVEAPPHFFEIVVEGNEVLVYGYDEDMKRFRLGGVAGRVRVHRGGTVSERIPLRFHPDRDGAHTRKPDPGYLQGHGTGLGRLESGTVGLDFRLTGVPGHEEPQEFEYVHRLGGNGESPADDDRSG